MKAIKFFLVLLLLLAIQSCKDSQESSNSVFPLENNFVYPLKIGNKWNYHVSMVYTNVHPDSIISRLESYSTDTEVSVTRDTILNSIKVYEVREQVKDNSDSYRYYANREDGLINYAYSLYGSGYALPKKVAAKRFFYKGIYFNTVSEFLDKINKDVLLLKPLNDSLIYVEPPRIVYAYPLEIGKEWVFSPSVVLINKKVIEKIIVYTAAGSFQCYKIQRLYDLGADGKVDDDLICYEYVSSRGLIKTELIIKNIAIASSDNPDSIIGTCDIKEERILTGINSITGY